MILDKSMQIAADQGSITSAVVYGTNWIDLTKVAGLQSGDIPVFGVVNVGTAFAAGTSLTFELITASAPATDVAGTGLGSVTVEASSGAIPTASLAKDTDVWKFKLPNNLHRRYLGLKITPAGTFNAGTYSLNFTPQYALGAI